MTLKLTNYSLRGGKIRNYFMIIFLFFFVTNIKSAPQFTFQSAPFKNRENVITKPQDLLLAAQDALNYIKKHRSKYFKRIVHPGRVFPKKFKLREKHIKNTLAFIVNTLNKDLRRARRKNFDGSFRIQDPEFLNKNFKFIRWIGDPVGAKKNGAVLEPEKIRVTKYLILKVPGRNKKQGKFKCALYSAPKDERRMSRKQIKRNRDKLTRFKYTKQDIVKGVLDKKRLAEPLVWLTREGLEEALMQGSVVVAMPDGQELMFNIDKDNGISFDHKLSSKRKQKRYWYFCQRPIGSEVLKSKCKKNRCRDSKVVYVPEVTCAGDVYNLGLGKIIALRYKNLESSKEEIRLCVLSDTGGAFKNNLYQIDFLSGFFDSKKDFQDYISKMPEYMKAYFLLRK